MTDLHTRFRTLDGLSAPDLWYDIEERALAVQTTPRRNPWVLVTVMLLLLVLAIGGAVLVGSGVVKLPVSVDESASPSSAPSSSAHESTAASASPVEPVPASWTATGSMIGSRQSHTATRLVDGRVLVAGGTTGIDNQELASAEIYDPGTGSWTVTGNMIQARYGHTATLLLSGKVLVVGGGRTTTSAELYDPSTGTWSATGSMIEARNEFSATLLRDGTVLVAGGYITSGGPDPSSGVGGAEVFSVASAERYDPSTGQWTATAPMFGARSGHTATVLVDGNVLVAGGGPAPELYDPGSGQWAATGNMVEDRVGHHATLLLDGRVWVAGGANSSTGQVMTSAELYDPVGGSWTATTSVPDVGGLPEVDGPATLLPNGMVLLAGGVSSSGDTMVDSARLFDPSSGSWIATVGLIDARCCQTATLLLDGRVLVAGGMSSPSTVLASAELYDPGRGS